MILQLGNNIKQALSSIRSNKLRSILTMLGIIIGVGSVIVLLAAGKGAQHLILQQVEDLGSNIIFILPGGDGGQRTGPPASARGIIVKTLTLSDAEAIMQKGNVPSASRVSTFTGLTRTQISLGNGKELSINAQGRDRTYFEMKNFTLASGRIWNSSEEKSLAKVAILGHKAKVNIFGEDSGNVVGQRIKVKNQNFQIIGVLSDTGGGLGAAFGQADDENIIVPVEVAQKYLLGVDYLAGLQIEAVSESQITPAIDQATKLLRDRHNIREGRENDFSIRTQKEALDILGTITSVFTLFLAAVAAISLIVGGIGIMNIMLVVVTERTKEIGLRKAIGARRKDILLQFLIESISVTLVGGTIGIAIGLLGSLGLAQAGGWPFELDLSAIALAFGVSAVFGIVFGLYPANKASKLNPIDALRYE
ncbi:MAG: ABC transporter permease [Candidatus Gracilibacteria bacterium]